MDKERICENCSEENIIRDGVVCSVEQELNHTEDIIVNTFPCIGLTIFQKKIFVVHNSYAEILNKKNKSIELHIEFDEVVEYKRAYLSDRVLCFKMKNNQRHKVYFRTNRILKLSINALDGLI